MDTDWCTESVLQFALDLFQKHSIKCTIFATGDYACLKNNEIENIEVGLHPNFNFFAVDAYETELVRIQAIYPHAAGVSSHAMLSSTLLLDMFKKYNLKYDRNILRYLDSEAKPFYHFNGLLRLSIFWEDDIWFKTSPMPVFSPELELLRMDRYIFNFHPIHLFLNTKSLIHYDSFKPFQLNIKKLETFVNREYGTYSYFLDLVKYIRKNSLHTGFLRELLTPSQH